VSAQTRATTNTKLEKWARAARARSAAPTGQRPGARPAHQQKKRTVADWPNALERFPYEYATSNAPGRNWRSTAATAAA
jgi:hypothetical protein